MFIKYVGLWMLLTMAGYSSGAQTVPALTDTQAIREENSKLYGSFATFQTMEQSVPAAAHKVDDNTYIVVREPRTSHGSSGNPNNSTVDANLQNAAFNSDLIVIVEPREWKSQFTEGHRFIFSDYTATVDRVLFAKRFAAVLPGQKIVITRPGGQLQMAGNRVFGSVPGYQLFHLNEPYLMFLKLLSNGSFWISSEQAYLLGGQTVLIHPRDRHTENIVSREKFDHDVQTAIGWIRKGDE